MIFDAELLLVEMTEICLVLKYFRHCISFAGGGTPEAQG